MLLSQANAVATSFMETAFWRATFNCIGLGEKGAEIKVHISSECEKRLAPAQQSSGIWTNPKSFCVSAKRAVR